MNTEMIVVCGMARSGTSILTSLIGTHPDVLLVTDNQNGFSECNLVYPERQSPDWGEQIKKLRVQNAGKRLLMKRPWIEEKGRVWWERLEPVAVLATIKSPYGAQKTSWNKHQPDKDKDAHKYNTHFYHLNTFTARTGILINVLNIADIAASSFPARLAGILDLSATGFDTDILETRAEQISKKEYAEKYGLLTI